MTWSELALSSEAGVGFRDLFVVVLLLHLLGFLIPREILLWNSAPLRLVAAEVTGLAFALLTAVGLVNIVWRRVTHRLARRVTSPGDWIIYGLLAVQVLSGIGVAIFHSWGSSWFATSASPWLWSLVKLSPEVAFVSGLPWLVKLHIVNAFLLIGFFPFTRLVHILVLPNPYLWRKTQVVLWNWDRERVRRAD